MASKRAQKKVEKVINQQNRELATGENNAQLQNEDDFGFIGEPLSKSVPLVTTKKTTPLYDEVGKAPPTPTHRLTRRMATEGFSNSVHYIGFRLGRSEYRKGDCVWCDTSGGDEEPEPAVLQDCWADEKRRPFIKIRWLYTKDRIEEAMKKSVKRKRTAPSDLDQNELLYSNACDKISPDLVCGGFRLLPHDDFRNQYPEGFKRPSPTKKRRTIAVPIDAVFFCRRGWDASKAVIIEGFTWDDVMGLRDMVPAKTEEVVKAKSSTPRKTASTPKRRRVQQNMHREKGSKLKTIMEDDKDGEFAALQTDEEDADEDYLSEQSQSESENDETFSENEPSTPSRKRKRTVTAGTPSKRSLSGASRPAMTPTRKAPRTPSKTATTPRTPRSGRLLDITLPGRSVERQGSLTEFEKARERLHVSAVPDELPCREDEFNLIYYKLVEVIEAGAGDCIWILILRIDISGVPGTGKTATVQRVVQRLLEDVEDENLSPFQFVEINGMKLTDPTQSYVQLWQALSGNKSAAAQAADLLTKRFNTPSPGRQPVVVLVDELDLLVNKNQKVIYNFFNWPFLPHSRLIVIAIANTMDLPERLLVNKVSSRLGDRTRINFSAYTHQQLIQIVHSRLEGVTAFESAAVEFCARKVGAVSGDARRALDICRRAVEILEKTQNSSHVAVPDTPRTAKHNKHLVTMNVIDQAVKEMYSSSAVQTIQRASMQQRLFLFAVIRQVKRTGTAEVEFGHGRTADLKQRIKLHVTEADVVGATRNGPEDAVRILADQ
ncbi:Origin recognition complex, subunit 1 [Rhizophlyctis rosea]|nr:Origin recognition complex, subunit 1 [Rhizophlyctis rosea]